MLLRAEVVRKIILLKAKCNHKLLIEITYHNVRCAKINQHQLMMLL